MPALAPPQKQSAQPAAQTPARSAKAPPKPDPFEDWLQDRPKTPSQPKSPTGYSDPVNPKDEPAAPAAPRLGWNLERISIRPPAPIQAKLTINTPGDEFEQEADRIANQVVRPPSPVPKVSASQRLLARKPLSGGNSHQDAAPPIVHEVLRSPGQPLDSATRAFMEPRFGCDFSNVRIHSGPAAEQSAKAVHAKAYTAGQNIVFNSGRYAPGTHEGDRLLAHELAHTIQQSGASSGVIQRQPEDPNKPTATTDGKTSAGATLPKSATAAKQDKGDELVGFTMHVPKDVVDVKDLFTRINIFVFGRDTGFVWDVGGKPAEMKDVESARDKQINLVIPRRFVTTGLDPETKKAREQAVKDWKAMPGPAQANVTAETNKRYYEKSGDKPGTAIKKGEDAKAGVWNQTLVEVENDKRTLQALPPAIKQLLGPDASMKPQDYQHLLKIAEKLKQFTPEDLAMYKLLAIRATSDLDLFERAVDMFLARRDELRKALDEELKKQQNAKQPDAKDSPGAAKKPLDDASLAAMSESDRYDLARQKTAELTEAQLKAMIDNPGKTAKGFAKGALLLNTPETFEQIGKDIQEAAKGDANSWARWAAGTGAGAKLSGWLAALAGVLLVASYLTGIGEVATVAAIATAGLVLLGSTIALSFTESELRIKAASQATTVADFDRNNELAAEARATGIVSLGFLVIAALLHFTAKALFPKTMAKLGTAVKNFRERVRLKGSIYEIKPGIVSEMGSLKTELKGAVEAAKKDVAATADQIGNLSTEALAAELDKGTGIFDQSKLPADQKVNYGELIKTPEGRVAVEAYRAKLLEVLKTDIPAEIDRLAADLNAKVDAFLKDVDAAQNHDELAAAGDKVGDSLSAEAFNKNILEQKERVTNQKLEKAAAEAHKEAQDTVANLPPKRVKQDVYIMDQKGDDIGQADVIETDARGNVVFVEQKNATGIGKINPKTGQPFQDPVAQLKAFADKQIGEAGTKKANAILKGVSTRGDKGAAVPDINVIRSIKTIRFEIQGDTPQLRAAVEPKLAELRKQFPALQFEVKYGAQP